MHLLRDLRSSTKLLILLELSVEPGIKMKELAAKLDMTPQGVSEYLKRMEAERLVRRSKRGHVPTKKGVALLHDGLGQLREFTCDAAARLQIISSCEALAGAAIKEGEEVSLVMEGGRLLAYPGKRGRSRGTAATTATKGREVLVTGLEGIVELEPGKVTVLELPPPGKGGSQIVKRAELMGLVKRVGPDIIGAVGAGAEALANKTGLELGLRFGIEKGAMEAAEKGMDVLILASGGRGAALISNMASENAALEDPVRMELASLGKGKNRKR